MSPPNPPGVRRQRYEIWVGAFVIVGVIAVVVALFMLTNPALFRGRYTMTAIVENASGIRRGDPVQMRGVNIGRVAGFSIVPQGVAIDLEVDKQYPIPVDSQLRLATSGILGEMFVDVVPGRSPQLVGNGGVLHGTVQGGALSKVGDIASEAQGLMGQLQSLLSPDAIGNVHQSTAELTTLLTQLTALAQELRGVTATIGQAAVGAKRNLAGPELADTMENLAAATARLDDVSASLGVAASEAATILARIDRGEGSLGRLSRDDSLYLNANQALVSLREAAIAVRTLADDFQKHPKRYVNLSLF